MTTVWRSLPVPYTWMSRPGFSTSTNASPSRALPDRLMYMPLRGPPAIRSYGLPETGFVVSPAVAPPVPGDVATDEVAGPEEVAVRAEVAVPAERVPVVVAAVSAASVPVLVVAVALAARSAVANTLREASPSARRVAGIAVSASGADVGSTRIVRMDRTGAARLERGAGVRTAVRRGCRRDRAVPSTRGPLVDRRPERHRQPPPRLGGRPRRGGAAAGGRGPRLGHGRRRGGARGPRRR